MHSLLSRRAVPVLAGLSVAAGLAVPMAGQAEAATSTVQIVQRVDGPAGPGTRESALSAQASGSVIALLSAPTVPQQRWIKRDRSAGFATYESVKFPGKCLAVPGRLSGEKLTLAPCVNGNRRQQWTRGFTGGTFRKLENLDSARAATLESTGNTGNVVQRFFTGLKTQLWDVRAV